MPARVAAESMLPTACSLKPRSIREAVMLESMPLPAPTARMPPASSSQNTLSRSTSRKAMPSKAIRVASPAGAGFLKLRVGFRPRVPGSSRNRKTSGTMARMTTPMVVNSPRQP